MDMKTITTVAVAAVSTAQPNNRPSRNKLLIEPKVIAA